MIIALTFYLLHYNVTNNIFILLMWPDVQFLFLSPIFHFINTFFFKRHIRERERREEYNFIFNYIFPSVNKYVKKTDIIFFHEFIWHGTVLTHPSQLLLIFLFIFKCDTCQCASVVHYYDSVFVLIFFYLCGHSKYIFDSFIIHIFFDFREKGIKHVFSL